MLIIRRLIAVFLLLILTFTHKEVLSSQSLTEVSFKSDDGVKVFAYWQSARAAQLDKSQSDKSQSPTIIFIINLEA